MDGCFVEGRFQEGRNSVDLHSEGVVRQEEAGNNAPAEGSAVELALAGNRVLHVLESREQRRRTQAG